MILKTGITLPFPKTGKVFQPQLSKEERRLAWVRPEVLHDAAYEVDEPVEGDA